MQIYCFIKHSKSSYFDLQFIILKTVKEAKNIQKMIIFINNISNICLIIIIITKRIQILDYPNSSSLNIKL